ncbi:hypothetical protein [Oceanobacillus profundus]|uniref:Uncharacterized protein n=1 Tax=Oceanobacillus profundus TaxID=372463 RepID=A0A417YGQ3_9BACI|nr:hypothetical protein [Oceanobacillus profundus]RHW31991.1 hypothetical protein D1B32_12195 [Oceanobacillus profundus]
MPSPTIEYTPYEFIENLPSLSIGKRIVIVGESHDGPYYEPIIVHNMKVAEGIYQYGPLLERYRDALQVDDSIEVIFLRIEENRFDKAYQVLLSYTFDLIYFDNFNFGKSEEDIQKYLDFAGEKEYQGELVHGFFSIEPHDDLDKINSIISSFTFDNSIDIQEMGKYISLVLNQTSGYVGAMIYAALVTSLNPEVSPVNKQLDIYLHTEYTKNELLQFQKQGIVAFRSSILNGNVISNATCAVQTPGSVHKSISNFRISQHLINELSNVFHNEIGEVQNEIQINRIQALIEEKLQDFIDLNRIRQGDYTIIANNIQGEINIELEFVPIFTTSTMTGHTKLNIYR